MFNLQLDQKSRISVMKEIKQSDYQIRGLMPMIIKDNQDNIKAILSYKGNDTIEFFAMTYDYFIDFTYKNKPLIVCWGFDLKKYYEGDINER